MGKFLKILFQVFYYLLTILVVIIYVGVVIELLKKWIGFLAYLLWLLVAPIIVPVVVVLPWFDSWVTGEGVNQRVLVIWAIWVAITSGIPLVGGLIDKFRMEKGEDS